MEPATPLPFLIPAATIAKWLPEIFPEGTANRTYIVRQMAARTIFVMLYAGAVEGTNRWLRPDQVTKMTDSQAAKTDDRSREKWAVESVTPGGMKQLRGRWYAANTREPIRDETLRVGLVAVGAVVERTGCRPLLLSPDMPWRAISSRFCPSSKRLQLNRLRSSQNGKPGISPRTP